MKISIILLLAALCCSCTVVKTRSAAGGEAMFASVGGDSKTISIGPDGAQMAENRNSLAFGKAITATSTLTGVVAAARLAGN